MAGSSQRSDFEVDEISLKISEEGEKHLIPIVEDIAEWLSNMFEQEINVDNFLDMLDNGSLICHLAKRIQTASENFCLKRARQSDNTDERKPLPKFENKIHVNAKKESFQARDNAANFIRYFVLCFNHNFVLINEFCPMITCLKTQYHR